MKDITTQTTPRVSRVSGDETADAVVIHLPAEPRVPHDPASLQPQRPDRLRLLPEKFLAELQHIDASGLARLAATSQDNHELLAREVASRCVRDIMVHMEQRIEAATTRTLAEIAQGPSMSRGNKTALFDDLLSLGKTADANRLLAAWVGTAFMDGDSHRLLIQSLLRSGDGNGAIVCTHAALVRFDARFCDSVRLNFVRGRLIDKQLWYAKRALRNVARLGNPDPAELALVRAMVTHSAGDPAGARARLDAAIGLLSGRDELDECACQIAEVCAWLGDAAGALRWMARAARSGIDENFTRVLFSAFTDPIVHDVHWNDLRNRTQELLDTFAHHIPAVVFPEVVGSWPVD